MPSVKNPNGPSRLRVASKLGKIKKEQQRRSRAGQTKISKSAAKRGARPGLLPTSGPGAALSKKKKRKLEKAMAHALRRKVEAGDVRLEVEMADATDDKTRTNSAKKEKQEATSGFTEVVEDMDIE